MVFVRLIIQLDLDYCSSIWNDVSAGISAKLQRIEKRCLRVLDGRCGREPTGDIFTYPCKIWLEHMHAMLST